MALKLIPSIVPAAAVRGKNGSDIPGGGSTVTEIVSASVSGATAVNWVVQGVVATPP